MMNPERIKVYYDLIRVGICSESIKLFPGAPKRFFRINGACFMLETSQGKYALWMVSKEENELSAEIGLLRLLEEKGIRGFLFPIRLKNDYFYSTLKDGRVFFLTDWPDLRSISYRNDILSLLKLVINFRKVMDSPELSAIKFKTLQKSLIDRYQDMIKSFKSFWFLANYRLHPTVFDQLFLKHSDRFIKEAELSLNLIQNSTYSALFEAKESFRPIINNFNRSNLRALPNGQVMCISLKECLLDVSLVDLALLMAKTGRANGWGSEWYEGISQIYNESFLMTKDDLEVVRAYLAFPWESYRLVARYYHNRVNWPVCLFVEKMERILESNGNKNKLLFQV